MRVILAGGGTGGHLFPGLAVAREFRKRDAMTEILFVGTEQGIEARVLPREGFRLETIRVKGIKGRGLRGWLDALYGVPVSVAQSLRIVGRFRPDCILGLGGYASGPVLLAGAARRVRCAIMEQNLRPGFTNKLLGRVVDRIFTSYPESAAFFPAGKTVQTGNPVRWTSLPPAERNGKFTVLIFGGSLGAHRLNVAAIEAFRGAQELAATVRVIHQTGQADFAEVERAYRSLPFEAEVRPFFERMDEVYARADLVVCRAGATTVAELTALGKAAVLVPYPYAIYDHQRWNAKALEDAGAAEMILDRELTGEALAARIRKYRDDQAALERMAAAARALGRPDAAARVVAECYALIGA
ncbi:MAG TPA: undecaprenyldiphospho-muramoylpentapeptide beta-N-acetylglucosaminyltransferase [candidate division Zixibacteria bacterium]|nr:undecaprenyldiphospho-muramoylpentapeptide beta-N-acetylglucosaminyltransferase [candidate division Zixibacteria bacterium]